MLMLFVDLLAQLPRVARKLIVDLRGSLLERAGRLLELTREVGGAAGAIVVFGRQPLVQALDFTRQELFEVSRFLTSSRSSPVSFSSRSSSRANFRS